MTDYDEQLVRVIEEAARLEVQDYPPDGPHTTRPQNILLLIKWLREAQEAFRNHPCSMCGHTYSSMKGRRECWPNHQLAWTTIDKWVVKDDE